jgi:hypothetical protein
MDMSSQDDSLSEKTQANFPDDIKLLYCTEINGHARFALEQAFINILTLRTDGH